MNVDLLCKTPYSLFLKVRFEVLVNKSYKLRPLGQVVKTPPFHGDNMGSNPVGVTRKKRTEFFSTLFSTKYA